MKAHIRQGCRSCVHAPTQEGLLSQVSTRIYSCFPTPVFVTTFMKKYVHMYTYELKIYCWFLPGINSLCFKLWFLYGGGVVRFYKYDYFVRFLPPPGDYSYCIYLGWIKGGYYPLCTPLNTRRHCNCCCYCNYHF